MVINVPCPSSADVFLVNFCTESPAKEEWRILLQAGLAAAPPRCCATCFTCMPVVR
jgi:hypothetical protein